MGVRKIFKILIGTILGIVMVSLIIEFINISLVSTRITLLTQMAVKQSCVMFGQETYKREDAQVVNMNSLVGLDGTTVSGRFYTYDNADRIYSDLYETSTFKSWLSSDNNNKRAKPKDTWSNLHMLAVANGWSNGTAEELAIGKVYKDTRMTPLNMGVTYLDKSVVQRIARWTATMIFNNGAIETDASGNQTLINLKTDGAGNTYVMYDGYRVYTDNLEVRKINYTVYDLQNYADKKDFEAITGLDADILLDNMGDVGDRRYFCIADIEYTIPVAYDGITPIKNIMNFAWQVHVDGYDGAYSGGSAIGNTWQDSVETMAGGGLTGSQTLPTTGRIIYYVTR